MDMSYDLLQTQQGRVSPRMIQANRILGLSSLELQQEIQREIADNPALEATEQATCPACGRLLTHNICQRCPSDARGARQLKPAGGATPRVMTCHGPLQVSDATTATLIPSPWWPPVSACRSDY